jgi:hypothetical protein
MVLAGFADFAGPDPTFRERPFTGEAEHVAWSVPPQAAAGLVDRADEWRDLSEVHAEGVADGPKGAEMYTPRDE